MQLSYNVFPPRVNAFGLMLILLQFINFNQMKFDNIELTHPYMH